MTTDDILRMALESGFSKDYSGVYFSCGGSVSDSDLTLPLKRFAALVAAAEREACAKVCEAEAEKWEGNDGPICFEARLCAVNIRSMK